MTRSAKKTFAEEELFHRDLAEVHLLIDHISGRTDKSLESLAGKFLYDAEGKKAKAPLSSQRVIEEICKISYPPTGDREQQAQQAAYMLAVKDELNALAQPAKGLTVAFTQMFSGIALPIRSRSERPAAPRWSWDWLRRWWGKTSKIHKTSAPGGKAGSDPGGAEGGSAATDGGGSQGANGDGGGRDPGATAGEGGPRPCRPNTFFSAREAYPNLEVRARRFRRDFDRIPLGALLLIVVIVYLSWDAGITSALLSQMTTAENDYAKLYASDRKFIPTDDHCRPYWFPASATPASQPSTPPPTRPASAPLTAPAPKESSTEKLSTEELAAEAQRTNEQVLCRQASALAERQHNDGLNLSALVFDARNLRFGLFHPIAYFVYRYQIWFSPKAADPAVPPGSGVLPHSSLEDTSLAVLNASNATVMPMLFGLLGTFAGVARSVGAKVRDNVLAPRDHNLMRVSIVLGATAGLAVGLLFNPSDSSMAKQLGGAISISAASLAFLAGLGAETFFNLLDQIISRIFTLAAK